MKILVVDDDPALCEALELGLRRRGHEVATAPDGGAALDVATRFRPDAVLLDVALPDISGIALAARLRDVVPEGPVRIVGFSGISSSKLRAATDRGVFDEYVFKPATLDLIEATLAINR